MLALSLKQSHGCLEHTILALRGILKCTLIILKFRRHCMQMWQGFLIHGEHAGIFSVIHFNIPNNSNFEWVSFLTVKLLEITGLILHSPCFLFIKSSLLLVSRYGYSGKLSAFSLSLLPLESLLSSWNFFTQNSCAVIVVVSKKSFFWLF